MLKTAKFDEEIEPPFNLYERANTFFSRPDDVREVIQQPGRPRIEYVGFLMVQTFFATHSEHPIN